MAEATTEITVTPKQLGKHLRSIRRKKGLSLSEVARGAGLSRRELVAYERGKVPVPESDLWVLAGSCGVDVAELVPTAPTTKELTAVASSTSVGDTVSQLRRSQEDAGVTRYLHTLQKLQALPPGKRIPVKERELEEIATALGSTPRSIEQKLQDVLHVAPDEAERLRAMILVPPSGRGKPRALAAAPSAVEAAPPAAPAAPPVVEPAPVIADVAPAAPIAEPEVAEVPAADAPVSDEPLQTLPAAPAAFLDQPLDAPIDSVHGQNVDVFEELARLPEPVPLGDPSAPVPDLLAPQDPFAALPPLVGVPAAPPEGTVELVDNATPSTLGLAGATSDVAPAWNAADAPPIDVAARQGSSTWDLGEHPLEPRPPTTPDPSSWETDGWQPPTPPESTTGMPAGFWEGTDDWSPTDDGNEVHPPGMSPFDDVQPVNGETAPGETVIDESMIIGEDTWAGSTWDPTPWASDDAGTESGAVTDVNPWMIDEWPKEPADRGAWEHQPDQAAVDSGFYVDWGTPETETPPGWDASTDELPTATTDAPVDATFDQDAAPVDDAFDALVTDTVEDATDDAPAADAAADADADGDALDVAPWDRVFANADVEAEAVIQPEPETIALVEDHEDHEDLVEPPALAPISWRADALELEAGPAVSDPIPGDVFAFGGFATDAAWGEPETTTHPDSDLEAEPVAEQFVTAGSDWQLGNALPLVEVSGQGGLVMRRADERWALADVTTSHDFVAEVEVDFKSGPGLGVLFRASIDDDGRMSGYSFDIDPIYDGGGYLVRQWQADRELWNPIARVSGDDPASMYGNLLVRVVVVGDHLSASVNGVEVLTVENLKEASADRGRDAAEGDRVGVQAWSSSDLVIDTVRVASR